MDDYQRSMATAGDVTSGLSNAIAGLTKTVRNLGAAMTVGAGIAGAALYGLSQRAGRVAESFREVDTISRSVRDAQAEYGQLVKDINTQFGLQANRLDVIEALYQSVSAGIEEGAESQREFLTVASRLAAVGRADLAETVDVLSTVLNTYRMNVSEAERVSRTLFGTVQFGKVRLEELAPVMGRVAALGSEMNVAIEELGASMAILTRDFGPARVSATGLRNVMRSFMRPSKEMKNVLEEIALENRNITEQWQRQSNTDLPNVSDAYRDARDAVQKFEEAQASLRNEQDELSLKIQRSRLAIQAIEQNRIDQLEDEQTAELARNQTIQELESSIEDYRLQLKDARVQEEEARLESEKHKETVEELRKDFKQNVDVAGDLEDGIGSLVVGQQGLVQTLIDLREKSEENNVAFSEFFNRTRALQAALALVGEDGSDLQKIFTLLRDEGELTEEQISNFAEELDMTEGKLKDAISQMENMEQIEREVRGPTQDLRDGMSRLRQALTDLGDVFKQDTFQAIIGVSDAIVGLIDRFKNMEQSTRESISQFAVLSVALGLILGPLLFFGGQIALIGQALGTSLIPFLGVAGTLLGTLGIGFNNAASGGEEAEAMFNRMQSVIEGIIDFVVNLKDIFVEEVLPGMINAASGLISVFQAIGGELSSQSEEGENSLRSFASVVGSAFSTIGSFLENNADTIANFIGFLVDSFFNEVIPAIQDFAQFVVQKAIPRLSKFADKVVQEVEPALISIKDAALEVADALIRIAQSDDVKNIINFLENGAITLVEEITNLVETIGNFIAENEELLLKLTGIAATVGAVLVGIGALKAILLPLTPVIMTIVGGIGSFMTTLATLGAGLTSSAGIMLTIKAILVSLGSALSFLASPLVLIAVLVAGLAAAWATDFMGMRDALQPVVDALVFFGKKIVDEIVPAVTDLVDSIIDFVVEIGLLIAAVAKAVHWFFTLGGESETLKFLIAGIGLTIVGLIDIAKGLIEVFAGVFDIFTGILRLLRGDLDGAFAKFKEGIDKIITGIINIIEGLGMTIGGILLSVVGTIFGIFYDIFEGILNIIIEMGKGVIDGIGNFVNNIIEWFTELALRLVGASIIPDMVDDIVEVFMSMPGRVISVLGDIVDWFTNLPGKITGKIAGLTQELVSKWLEHIVDPIIGTYAKLINWYADFVTKVFGALPGSDRVAEIGSDIADDIISGFTNVFDFFNDLFPGSDAIIEFGKDIVDWLVEGIKKVGSKIHQAVKDFIIPGGDGSSDEPPDPTRGEGASQRTRTTGEVFTPPRRSDVTEVEGEVAISNIPKQKRDVNIEHQGSDITINEAGDMDEEEIRQIVREEEIKSKRELVDELDARGRSSTP